MYNFLYPRGESNPNLKNRNLQFYPLNYGGKKGEAAEGLPLCLAIRSAYSMKPTIWPFTTWSPWWALTETILPLASAGTSSLP